jgi:plasmid stabilization system protein ParE
MKKYKVIIEPSAHQDLRQSYLWGTEEWDVAQAKKWLREIRKAAMSLSSLPERHPIAPESDEFNEEVRQLVYGRYRILFTIRQKTVYILHCRGAYTGGDLH